MRSFQIAGVVAVLVAGVGCSTLSIKKVIKPDKYQGIPFYVKKGGCKNQVVTLEPYYILSLTQKVKDVSTPLGTIVLLRKEYGDDKVSRLIHAEGTEVVSAWREVKTLVSLAPTRDRNELGTPAYAKQWYEASSSTAPFTYVDYGNAYTFNAKRPLIGSVQADAKLADDGTLTEGSAQSEDKTLSTFLRLIPATDLIKGAVMPMSAMSQQEVELLKKQDPTATEAAVEYELKIEEKGIVFTKIDYYKQVSSPCNSCALGTATSTDYSVDDVGGDKKDDKGDAIKVNGTVQLPKDTKPKK